MTVAWRAIRNWDDDDWRYQAACRDSHAELFFPVGSTGEALEQLRKAKSVCRSCPVKGPCLEFALATNQDAGIWGGTDEEERRKLRAARRAALRRSNRSVTP